MGDRYDLDNVMETTLTIDIDVRSLFILCQHAYTRVVSHAILTVVNARNSSIRTCSILTLIRVSECDEDTVKHFC